MEKPTLEQDFKNLLRQNLKDPRLRYNLEESVKSGYLSVQSLKALDIIDWTKFAFPAVVRDDQKVPTQFILTPESLDLKEDLLHLLNYCPPEVIFKWIVDVLRETPRRHARH